MTNRLSPAGRRRTAMHGTDPRQTAAPSTTESAEGACLRGCPTRSSFSDAKKCAAATSPSSRDLPEHRTPLPSLQATALPSVAARAGRSRSTRRPASCFAAATSTCREFPGRPYFRAASRRVSLGGARRPHRLSSRIRGNSGLRSAAPLGPTRLPARQPAPFSTDPIKSGRGVIGDGRFLTVVMADAMNACCTINAARSACLRFGGWSRMTPDAPSVPTANENRLVRG